MDELHGVLMHGDKKHGTDHTKDDQEKMEKEAENDYPPSHVENAHQFMHQNDDNDVHYDRPRMDVGPKGTEIPTSDFKKGKMVKMGKSNKSVKQINMSVLSHKKRCFHYL